jgi:predicted Zn finger-like uncharacterized protein
MILTCPECATRYFVDDARVGPQGRQVRCAACGHRWTAVPEDEQLVLADPLTAPLATSSAAAAVAVAGASASAEAATAATPLAESPATVAQDLPAEELPKVFRKRAQTRLKEREAATTGVIWAALAGAVAVLIAAIILLRQDIAQIWPRTASVYAMAGLPVNLVGLVIESQHAQPMLKDGHADLAVSGTLRNVRGKPVAAPPLKISLLAPGGRVVATQIANPGAALIPAGETRRFVVDVLDPPVSATDVEIAFVFSGRAAKTTASVPPPSPSPSAAPPASPGTPAPASLDLRGSGPPAEDATPLPSSSPYALPAAANVSDDHG